MSRGIRFLTYWLLLTIFLGGAFIQAIPPGGVLLPFYVFLMLVPVGALYYARYPGRASVVIIYGEIAGFYFALPIFADEQSIARETTTIESAALGVFLFTVAMSFACWAAFSIGRREIKSKDANA